MTETSDGFATSLRMCRAKADLTQFELADMVGSDVQSVRNWEKGVCMPSMRLAVRLADALEVSMDQLVGRAPLSVT